MTIAEARRGTGKEAAPGSVAENTAKRARLQAQEQMHAAALEEVGAVAREKATVAEKVHKAALISENNRYNDRVLCMVCFSLRNVRDVCV